MQNATSLIGLAGVINIAVQINTLGFFGKYYRYVKILGCDTGDPDTGGFPGFTFPPLRIRSFNNSITIFLSGKWFGKVFLSL